MKKLLAILIIATLTSQAFAASAFHTGKRESVRMPGGGLGWNCEYQSQGIKFWRSFSGGCPSTIEI